MTDAMKKAWAELPEDERHDLATHVAMWLAHRGRYTPSECYRALDAQLSQTDTPAKDEAPDVTD